MYIGAPHLCFTPLRTTDIIDHLFLDDNKYIKSPSPIDQLALLGEKGGAEQCAVRIL